MSSVFLVSSPPSQLSFPPSSKALPAPPSPSRSHLKPRIVLLSKAFNGLGFYTSPVVTNVRRVPVTVKASGDIKGAGPDSGETESSQSGDDDEEEDVLPSGILPLDVKLQLKLERKMKMKLAKKIRLRRKKLVHKRRMRKRGKWPPSKVNKLKNV